MTKQEQIYEMAKIVDEMYNVYTTTADDIAEGLYNAGYRKTFTSDLASDTQKAFKEGYEKARKETAKEIMQCLYDKCYEIQNLRECVAHITPLDILQLAKHYGVEVEE